MRVSDGDRLLNCELIRTGDPQPGGIPARLFCDGVEPPRKVV